MTNTQFWNLIDQSRQGSGDCKAQTERLQQILSTLPPTDIVEFQQIFADRIVESYRWDLWGVAWLIGKSCSDDSFEYFCRWLIGQGKVVYEQALVDPQSIANCLEGNDRDIECEELFYAGGEAYEAIIGEIMPSIDLAYPRHPVGEPWTSKEVVERFPQVAQRYGTES